MSIAIPHTAPNRIPIDLALVIALTLACILFVLTPRLDETPRSAARALPAWILAHCCTLSAEG